MLIPHPLLGPRDAQEFIYLGDAQLLNRPHAEPWESLDESEKTQLLDAFYEYIYLRENPAGRHLELWYHEAGDRSWLIVTRDTRTHEIIRVELASQVVLAQQAEPSRT